MRNWILSSAMIAVFMASSAWAQDATPETTAEADQELAPSVDPAPSPELDKAEPEKPEPKTEEAPRPEEASSRTADVPEIDFVFTEAPDDHAIGSEEAVQTMIVYASVTCSHCADWFSKEWPTVKTELIEKGKIRFVFRPLPTAPAILSMTGFAIAECAPEYDYFPVIEHQMENQQLLIEQAQAGKGQEAYTKVGKLAGLEDEEAVQACLREQSNIEAIQLSAARANAGGVMGVPAFFINGELYKGEQDAKTLIDLIAKMDEAGVTKLPELTKKDDKEGSEGP